MEEENINAEAPISVVDFTNIFTFKNIIYIPVEAIINANINASLASFNFIKEFGFEPGEDPNKLGKPRMLRFSYKFNNAGVEQKMVVEIPVLSLVPLPFLTIKKAKFDVGINVLNNVKIQTGTNLDTNEPETITETLVLLGPAEQKKLRIVPSSINESYNYESGYSSNMQASIEIETSDLPAGILTMINLLQDATSGEGKDVCQLNTNKQRIKFDPTQTQIAIKVQLQKNNTALANELIVATVVSETDPALKDSFEKPIEIEQGYVVGIPTLETAKALSNNKGEVVFKFTAKMKNAKEPQNENGYIYFNSAKAQKIAVYYQLTNIKNYEESNEV